MHTDEDVLNGRREEDLNFIEVFETPEVIILPTMIFCNVAWHHCKLVPTEHSVARLAESISLQNREKRLDLRSMIRGMPLRGWLRG